MVRQTRTFRIKYRIPTVKQHGNADALSRMADESNIDASPENNQIIVNAIHLKGLSTSNQQLRDPDIKWIIDLKSAEKIDEEKRPKT